VDRLEVNSANFGEFGWVEASLHEVEAVFVESSDHIDPPLVFLLDVLSGVLVQISLHLAEVGPPQEAEDISSHRLNREICADPHKNKDGVAEAKDVAEDYPENNEAILLNVSQLDQKG